MDMIKVTSSAIEEIGYNELTQEMRVKFHKNPVTYSFCGVPKHIFYSFLNAPSKGTFYDVYIKGRYRCPGF
ncbi:KTSC domain-containing protein [Campylobacter majalis]|uniref:KTSC domain-containing protein n=1 Tax=Campylobacter majalis TaxID=2790656 RepID=UPI003D68DE99